MKQITIHAPEAWAVVAGIRKVDCRVFKQEYRGRVLVATTGYVDDDQSRLFHKLPIMAEALEKLRSENPGYHPFLHVEMNAIIGSVELLDCLTYEEYLNSKHFEETQRPFLAKNRVMLVFGNPIFYQESILVRKVGHGLCDPDPMNLAECLELEDRPADPYKIPFDMTSIEIE